MQGLMDSKSVDDGDKISVILQQPSWKYFPKISFSTHLISKLVMY